MKRIALILAKLFAVCAALGLCVVLYLFSVGYFDPQPAIGYLHSPKELPYVDRTHWRTALKKTESGFFWGMNPPATSPLPGS